jgi:hypothetical protein
MKNRISTYIYDFDDYSTETIVLSVPVSPQRKVRVTMVTVPIANTIFYVVSMRYLNKTFDIALFFNFRQAIANAERYIY